MHDIDDVFLTVRVVKPNGYSLKRSNGNGTGYTWTDEMLLRPEVSNLLFRLYSLL